MVFDRTANDVMTVHESIRLTKRRDGSSKVYQELVSGDAQRSDGTWVVRQRLVDREQDLYEETVLAADGSVIHHDSGPLTRHVGHGFDKPARRHEREEAKRVKAQSRAARKALRDAHWSDTASD